MKGRTSDGLPIVTEETFNFFVRSYPLVAGDNDPEVTRRIERDNPQIYRLLKLVMEGAPNKKSRAYYEMGVQICYELLRLQNSKLEETAKR